MIKHEGIRVIFDGNYPEPHSGSLILKERVASWNPEGLFHSKEFGWYRWGLMGMLGDYVLSFTQGDIIEIGLCESSLYLTALAEKYKRKVYHCDPQWSVIENCFTVPGYFGKDSEVYWTESDIFFKEVKFDKQMALIFIDGDHVYDQVKKDFNNALEVLVPNGFIFMHDTAPPNKEWTEPNRCGTVYQLRKEIEQDKRFQIFTFENSAWDVGLSIVKRNTLYYGE